VVVARAANGGPVPALPVSAVMIDRTLLVPRESTCWKRAQASMNLQPSGLISQIAKVLDIALTLTLEHKKARHLQCPDPHTAGAPASAPIASHFPALFTRFQNMQQTWRSRCRHRAAR
jgi:hypothetical protein